MLSRCCAAPWLGGCSHRTLVRRGARGCARRLVYIEGCGCKCRLGVAAWTRVPTDVTGLPQRVTPAGLAPHHCSSTARHDAHVSQRGLVPLDDTDRGGEARRAAPCAVGRGGPRPASAQADDSPRGFARPAAFHATRVRACVRDEVSSWLNLSKTKASSLCLSQANKKRRHLVFSPLPPKRFRFSAILVTGIDSDGWPAAAAAAGALHTTHAMLPWDLEGSRYS